MSSWEDIDNGWGKVDFGFKTTETLSSNAIEFAREFYRKTEIFKEQIEFDEDTSADIYLSCLYLVVRSFIGLMKRNIDTNDDLDHLRITMDRIPSNGERAKVWSEIARGYIINKRVDDNKRIVNEFIRPSLKSLSNQDKSYWSEIFIFIAPCLYYAHRLTALEEIEKLTNPKRDEVISSICDFIMFKICN